MRGLPSLLCAVVLGASAGCSLALDFDDGTGMDAGMDAGMDGAMDGGMDAMGGDGSMDGAEDVGGDTRPRPDGAADAAADVRVDGAMPPCGDICPPISTGVSCEGAEVIDGKLVMHHPDGLAFLRFCVTRCVADAGKADCTTEIEDPSAMDPWTWQSREVLVTERGCYLAELIAEDILQSHCAVRY